MDTPRRREFRSDTMTIPTAAMRDAMRDAEVGDDVCDEDPTVHRLQAMAAETLGKEAALFTPSGVFANQCAVGLHAGPGDEVIASETSHYVEHESGAAGALWGIQLRAVPPARTSYLAVEDILPRLRTDDDVHIPHTRAIVLENALSDGTAMPLDAMRRVRGLAAEHGVKVHLDGARLFNAALALGAPAADIAAQADSVAFCLSKGLGAPVGSMLCGTKDFILRARRRRKRMGGGMRQVGVLAAPGILALTEGVARLAEDHANARLLGELLAAVPGIDVDLATVQTNMVWCRVAGAGKSEEELVRSLAARDIHTYPPLHWGVRFVVSREVDEDDVRALADAVREYMV
jgi:threonine aldolase